MSERDYLISKALGSPLKALKLRQAGKVAAKGRVAEIAASRARFAVRQQDELGRAAYAARPQKFTTPMQDRTAGYVRQEAAAARRADAANAVGRNRKVKAARWSGWPEQPGT